MNSKNLSIYFLFLGSLFLLNSDVNAQCVSHHSIDTEDNWRSCQISQNPNPVRGNGHWIQYDFGQNYILSNTHVWNYNVFGETDIGFKEIVIDYSLDGINWIEWGIFEFTEASGTINESGFDGPDLSGVMARFINITGLNNWGGNCYGLGEMRFDIINGMGVDLKIFLEGPYAQNGTMKNDLFLQSLIPLNQPYFLPPYNYSGSESLVNVPTNMVDWVLVEAREGTPNLSGTRGTTTIETKAALLLETGEIVGVNGLPLTFETLIAGQAYYFCIRHRNHLDVLTANPLILGETNEYDFTLSATQAFGAAQQKIMTDGKAALFAADFTKDGIIQTTDYDAWSVNPAILNTYSAPDANLDGSVQTTDYDVWFWNKAKIGSVEIGY